MNLLIYIKDYFVWHYTKAISDLFFIWKDVVWFVYNYFSISLLIKTLFLPWKRMGEERKGFFDFAFILIDVLMRIFGAIIRVMTIIIGFLCVSLMILLGPVFLFIWLALPFLMLSLIFVGLNLIIN